jgi:hypothetical protein
MKVHQIRNTGATDYWRFPWIRQKAHGIRQKGKGRFTEFVCWIDQPNPDVYYPLEENPGISREFASLRNSSDVLEFANAYGLLGLEKVPGTPKVVDPGEEPVRRWLSAAAQLKYAYLLLDSIASNDERELAKMIRYRPGENIFTAKLPTRWKPGELIDVAKRLIAEDFNQRMTGMASPALLLDAAGSFRSYNSPSSLLAAVWLEFGQIASGARKQMICESCGKWMDVTENRTNKRKHDNCSLREKMARYRKSLKDKENGKTKTR